MSVIRRFQAPVIAVLLVLLASPAVAACCVWATAPMACCEKSEGDRLAAPCCMSQAPDGQQQVPASPAKLSRAESAQPVTLAAIQPLLIEAPASSCALEQVAGSPGSDPLYLRLSVIRR